MSRRIENTDRLPSWGSARRVGADVHHQPAVHPSPRSHACRLRRGASCPARGRHAVASAPSQRATAGRSTGPGLVPPASPGVGEAAQLGRDAALRVSLLSKGRRYFYNAQAAVGPQRRSCPSTTCHARHVERCALAHEHDPDPRLLTRCVLAGSSPVACGACGAPYRRPRPGENATGIRRPTCPHNNPKGRCLVLDPFYRLGAATAEAAHRTSRSFLGITGDTGRVRADDPVVHPAA